MKSSQRKTTLCIGFAMAMLACSSFVVQASLTDETTGVNGPVVGIDLGTTYSCVGVYQNGGVDIIPNEQGNRITPSYVAWDHSGERLIGDAAKNMATTNPTQTIFDVKRLIGRDFKDPTVQADRKLLPYSIVDRQGKPYVEVSLKGETKYFTPEEISGMVLGKMKDTVETYLGQPVEHAVVTVPAYFNDAQRQATKDAGVISGLSIERIVNEPTAAAMAYGLQSNQKDKNILVYDLGGGTFDVTLLNVDDGIFEVLSTNGDTHLGGEDFDQRVMQYMIKVFKRKNGGLDITEDSKAMQRLRREVERVKRALSTQTQARVEIDSLYDGIDLSEALSRARFEELNMDLFKKTLKPVQTVLKKAGLTKDEVDEVVLVGGSTRIPRVQSMLRDFFNGKEPHKNLNPDEAVAYGAAVQGGILSGADSKLNKVILLDIAPLSQGIETLGGVMTSIIPTGTTLPVKKTKVFSTSQDNQDAVLIQVFEGERAMTKDNHLLGQFKLSGIPPAPRGVPQIEVTFEIDANGILEVSAKDTGTGKSEKVTVTSDSSTRLSEDEIERMKQEARDFEEQDNQLRARVDSRNGLEAYLYNLKNIVQTPAEQDGGVNLDATTQEELESVIEEALEWLETNGDVDAEDINEKQADVEKIVNPIMREVYQGGPTTENSEDYDFGDEDL